MLAKLDLCVKLLATWQPSELPQAAESIGGQLILEAEA